jgi:acyl-CoA synthetase (NDP forming)
MNQAQSISIAEMLEIRSVVIVGVSAKLGYYWVHSMTQWSHDLKLWLVSKSGGEINGLKIFQSLSEVPESIDYAIIAVPYRAVPEVLKECAEKGAKGATIFTSGYSELGTEEGIKREQELSSLAKELGIRVFGPNCMGLMYPKLGFAFMPSVTRRAGNVGFISQSGGVIITTYTAGAEAGVGFSKIFSYGNSIDINPIELLDFFEHDTDTDVVGAYLEGTERGRDLLDSLIRVASKKPVVVLKGGRSNEGSRAVSSHTGALAGSNEMWDTAFKQANVTTVKTLEDLIATLSLFSKCPPPQSRNIGIIVISGGTSVVYTDLAIEHGLKVPKTSPETLEKLNPLIRDVGTSINNPIDLAADYYNDDITKQVVSLSCADSRFDSIIMQADVHNIYQVSKIMDAEDLIQYLWEAMAKAGKQAMEKQKKPVLVVIPDVAYPEVRKEAWDIFMKENLPLFRNIREAVGALSRVCSYYERRKSRIIN